MGIGIRETFRGKTLHECADDAVRAWIPTSGNDSHTAVLLADGLKGGTVVEDACVDVEAIDGIDAEREDFLRIFLTTAGRGGKDSHIYIFQFGDVAHHLVGCQLRGLVG